MSRKITNSHKKLKKKTKLKSQNSTDHMVGIHGRVIDGVDVITFSYGYSVGDGWVVSK